MELIETSLKDLYIIKHRVFSDERGLFIKTYNKKVFDDLNLDIEVKERYFSISYKNVIRGMHFQTPPADHIKLVSVLKGKILDVVLDIRKDSNSYGDYAAINIEAQEGKTIYIPKGFAHGFLALENNTIVEYNQTSSYSPDNDRGVKYNSFGFDWGIEQPIISKRDIEFEEFVNFTSPF